MGNDKKVYLVAQLKRVPLFGDLSDSQLGTLVNAGIVKHYVKGSIIVRQTDTGNTFYTVVSGQAKVVLLNPDGKEIVLSLLKDGDFFGELSLLDDEPRSASVIVLKDATLFLITRTQFYKLITTHAGILKKVLKEIVTRLRIADEKIASLAFLDVYGRTIQILRQLAIERGKKTAFGIEIINAPTHQELAGMVGASREAITRIIQVLKKNKNLISYREGKVVLRQDIEIPFV